MIETMLPKSVFEVLVKHLVDLEEENGQLLEKYFPISTEEREVFSDLIKDYINSLEEYIKNAKIIKDYGKNCPFVVIGSIVEVEDLQDKNVERLRVVSPFENVYNTKDSIVSYLSPMGRALLLKKEKETVIVETPVGKCAYYIKSIEIPSDMFSILD